MMRRSTEERLGAQKVEAARLVARETAVLRALSHPGLPGLLDVFMSDNTTLWLVLEYGGIDLKTKSYSDRLHRANLAATQIRSFAHQTLTAVAHLHERGFLHRDLCPRQLLVDSTGRLKLSGFAFARRMRERNEATYTHAVEPYGTEHPRYSSGAANTARPSTSGRVAPFLRSSLSPGVVGFHSFPGIARSASS